MVDLKAAIDKQIQLQEQTNELLRGLITALEESGEATGDLTEAISQLGPLEEIG